MATVNEHLIYQPDDRPSHPASLAHGFQNVMTRMASMAATTAIIAVAGGQSEEYQSWIFFSVLAVCGIGTMLQTVQFWRFGSGYSLSVASSPVFAAVAISALLSGGPLMMSALMVLSGLIQFVFISRLSLLRRVITPLVAGTVLMLLSATVIPIVFARLANAPEGTHFTAAPVMTATVLCILVALRFFAPAGLRQWAPVVAILTCCVVAVGFGAYDFQKVIDAPWIGFPVYPITEFKPDLGAAFWSLVPGFVLVNMATTIISVSDSVAVQQVAWRRPRATDFQAIQGAHNLLVLLNILSAALAATPIRIGSGNSSRILLTGVATRRMGVYGGIVLILVALSPKIIALIVAIPVPILAAYIIFMQSLLFVQGMRMALGGGLDGRRAVALGLSFWIGIGFENQLILPHLLSGVVETLLSNGVTTGAICVILLTMLLEFTSNRRRRIVVAMAPSSLPRIDEFLQERAARFAWSEASINRLQSAGEETLSCLLSHEKAPEEAAGKRLVVSVRRVDDEVEMEFTATTAGANLQDKLAYLSDQPEIHDEDEISFRLLRHYASSVEHHKYHDIDIITVRVSPSP